MAFSKEIMKGVAETVVLKVLHELEEAYGYQLVKAIEDASNNIFSFQEGTLYPLLYRLEVKGLVKSEKKQAPNGKERRYYSLTKAGTQTLQEQTGELRNLQDGLKHVLSFTA